MTTQELYMFRCIELATSGAGNVAPNPMVGAVLVFENRIIGEGFHQQYGQAHAEVNCINSVSAEDQHLISKSTIYVSLEPCAHHGKTPPCADLVIAKKIPRVVVGCRDPFEAVNGKGIEKLRAAGVEVVLGILEKECQQLNKRFFTFHTKYRPYIVLKWAQTVDGFMAALPQTSSEENTAARLLITNDFTNCLVHKWRSEEAGILVGTNTALLDNPKLDNRNWTGKPPIKLVLDKQLILPQTLNVFNANAPTVVLNFLEDKKENNIQYYKINAGQNLAEEICKACYQLNIQSVLVEGGAQLLQAFIQQGIWDEARIITNEKLSISKGLQAPILLHQYLTSSTHIFADRVDIFTNAKN